ICARHRYARNAGDMSAVPPIATELMRCNEMSRRANRVLTHCNKKAPLFDHLVGADDRLADPLHAWNLSFEVNVGLQAGGRVEILSPAVVRHTPIRSAFLSRHSVGSDK